MGRIRYIFLFPLLQSLALGQGVLLKGVVILNEVGGTPLVGVGISADGANDTETAAGGKFRLTFPGKQVGDTVEVHVTRPGYVVVNWTQQKLNLPGVNSEELTLILCKETERELWASSFYRLKSLDAVEATYRERLHELEESNRSSAAEVAKLHQERDQARAAAEGAAAEFARVQPGDSTDLYAQAMSLFVQGRVAESLRLLDEKKLDAEMTGAEQKEEEARAERGRAVQGFLLRAQLLTSQYRFVEAEHLYAILAERLPDNFDAQYAYGYYSQGMNRFSTARGPFEQALAIARRDNNKTDVAMTLNLLGRVNAEQRYFDEARTDFDEALKNYRQLADKNPGAYLGSVAATLSNIGILDRDQNLLDAARGNFEEALKDDRQLADTAPDIYLPEVARVLDNLGSLDLEQNRLNEARANLEEALKDYRELAHKNPDIFLFELAITLRNVGILDHNQNRLDEARGSLEESLKDFRELADKNPDRYLPPVAAALDTLGSIDREQNRFNEARANLDESLKDYRELADKNPDAYLPNVASGLDDLSILDRNQDRLREARAHLSESLAIFSTLAEKDPQRFSTPKDAVAKELTNLR